MSRVLDYIIYIRLPDFVFFSTWFVINWYVKFLIRMIIILCSGRSRWRSHTLPVG